MSAATAVLRSLAVLGLLLLAVRAPAQTPADFGDAPDNTLNTAIEAYPGVPGRFPTLLNTANAAVPGNKGVHHLGLNEEWLAEPGAPPATTTSESDAKLVDLDEDDADVRIFCAVGACLLQVREAAVGAAAPAGPRYVNALVDVDRNGRWQSALPLGTWPREHVIVDKELTIAPGTERSVVSGLFIMNSTLPRWVRVTLTRAPLGAAGWDGSVPTAQAFGETEDHLVHPIIVPIHYGKEPMSHFRVFVTPNPVTVPPGKVTVDIVRRLPPGPYVPAFGFIVDLGWCMSIPFPGVNFAPPPGFVGGITLDVGLVTNDPALGGAVLPDLSTPPLPSLANAVVFTATFPPSQHGHFTICKVKVSLDPPGDVYEHDDAYQTVLPVNILQPDVPDGDGDGVPDFLDSCPAAGDPLRIEDLDGFADADGCLDADNDQDGVLDDADQCPVDLEDVDGENDTDGCPDPSFFDVFADVPSSHWAWAYVETLYNAGVAGGCATGPLRYCPAAAVTREQMAVFLLASRYGKDYRPPPAQGFFQDVPLTSAYAPWIEDLMRRGITGGCSTAPPLYCPKGEVTREQMAVFLLRTLEGPAYSPPPAQGLFQDVPASSPYARWVEELYRRRITGGCSSQPLLFCPAQTVDRAGMAVFLVTTFSIK